MMAVARAPREETAEPRCKPVHQGLKLLPVDFDKQVQPGSFEHAWSFTSHVATYSIS
jgi:hypothetical protein